MGGLVGICRAGSAVTGEATGDTFVGLRFLRLVFLGSGTSGAVRLGAASGGIRG